MKQNFAFVLGGATIAALVLIMCLSSCATTPDCPCDWYAQYYPECVDACSAAREWGRACGYPPMVKDCIDVLWDSGVPPLMCGMAAACYRRLTKAGECAGKPEDVQAGWSPPLWHEGCPTIGGG